MQQRRHNNSSNHHNKKNKSKRARARMLQNKYMDKAKEALGSGDRITAEYFFQYADHYARIANEG